MLACKIGFWFSKNEDGGNKELFLEALLYFEKSLEVAKVNGLPDGIMRDNYDLFFRPFQNLVL